MMAGIKKRIQISQQQAMNGEKIKREKRRKVEKSTSFIKLLRWNLLFTHKIFLGNVPDWKGPEEREPLEQPQRVNS